MIIQCGAEVTSGPEGVTLDLTSLGNPKVTMSLPEVSDLVGALVGHVHGLGRWAQLADDEARRQTEAETEPEESAMS